MTRPGTRSLLIGVCFIMSMSLFLLTGAVTGQTPTKKAAPSMKVILLELGAPRCPACRMIAPVIDEIEEQYAGQVRVVRYNVDDPEDQKITRKYNARYIPTLIFQDINGKQFYRHQGYLNKKQIEAVLRKKGVQ